MRHDLFRPVIGQGQQAAAIGHHFFGALAHGGEGIDRNIHRHGKIRGRGFDIAAAQLILVGKADGMDHEIKAAPCGSKLVEQRVKRGFVANIARNHHAGPKACRKRLHALEKGVALIGKGEFRPFGRECFRDAPCDGFVIGQPHDEPALPCHQTHFCPHMPVLHFVSGTPSPAMLQERQTCSRWGRALADEIGTRTRSAKDG